ncbi:MAG TPA: hypothetical protein VN364_00210 [Bellilinea sp.]|nr:hypothetical protein [Bellilinea sp.]
MTTLETEDSLVFAELRSLLTPYASQLVVTADSDRGYSLDTRNILPNRQPLFFGSVKV